MGRLLHFLKKGNIKCKTRNSFMNRAIIFMLFSILANPYHGWAQEQTISGTVISKTGQEFLPGVNIIIKGTTVGTVSDIDGKFSLKAKATDVLLISFIGFETQEITIGNKTELNIVLNEELTGLDEVIVIGYGVQKKKLNTGATLNVKGEDIEKLNTAAPMDALKGISPGVSITQNNGVPGSGTRVTIRGTGTIGNASPLYIVDGVAVGDIDYLSPSDIESIDVLKDAASAAIYGSRAANGVILVTTKKGNKKGNATITYDFYHGWQSAVKMLTPLNAKQYIEIINEGAENSAKEGEEPGYRDWENEVPNYQSIMDGTNTGTNWLDQIYSKNAPITSHAVSAMGGTERSSYSLGFSSLKQEGILGKGANNTYERKSVRLNTEHILIETHNKTLLKVGENLTYSNSTKPTIRTGNIYWNDLHNMLVASPLLPMNATDVEGNDDDPAAPYYYGSELLGINPVASMLYNSQNNYNSNNSIIGNIYAELNPIQNLTLRSALGINTWFGDSRSWTPQYVLGPKNSTERDVVNQSSYLGYTYTLTNTIAYNFNIQNTHNFSTVLGQENTKNLKSLDISGKNEGSIFQDYEHAYLDNTRIVDATYTSLNGKDEYGWGMMSYFGRISYDFNETFLATVVLRADGSSRFPVENRWGTFPSVSMGYILSNHDFMQSIPGLNYFKIRGSWGQNGNESIESYQHLSTLSYDKAVYFFGPDKTIQSLGAYPARVPNPDITWETSEQTSGGFDAHFMNNKLQFNFDMYQKITKDWLVLAPALATNGTNAAFINGGNITNKGIETAIRWTETRGDFSYGASAAFAFNKNEVTAINNEEKILHGPANVLSQGTSEMYRAEVGYPIGYFWGYETNGVIQNAAEAAAYVGPNGETMVTGDGKPMNVQPGDLRYVNQNGDSIINEDDKVMLGDPNPDFIFGFQLNAEYKGFYVQISANGAAGHQIAQSYRSFADGTLQNYTTDVYERWHGEGTSNTMPRLVDQTGTKETFISDIFIHDADYLKISNITVGYDLNRLFPSSPLSQARVYFTGQNLLTFTKYNGMDPEVGYSPEDEYGNTWGSGIDLGLYPASKSYMVGLSVKF